MGIINVLPTEISNKIAAGEVVERPASAIKELVENSIDAGATVITVEIRKGGITFMRVADNGKGMSKEDASLAFIRHATSKIKEESDLDAIYTLGFRGEALSSIGAVSQAEIYTKREEDEAGTHIACTGGEITESEDAGIPNGTVVLVNNLFYNTPARMNFLKRDATEAAAVTDIMERFILSHPEISFRYIVDGKEKYFTSGDNSLVNCIYAVYGKNYANSVIPVDYETEVVKITGMIGKSDTARVNRSFQSFFVNKRYIKSLLITKAFEDAYKNQLMTGKHPMAVLNIEINPKFIDINVHPTKLEVKFSGESDIFRAVFHAVENALFAIPNVPQIEHKKTVKTEFLRDGATTASQVSFDLAPQKSHSWQSAVSNQKAEDTKQAKTVEGVTSYALDASNEYFVKKQNELLGADGELKQAAAETPAIEMKIDILERIKTSGGENFMTEKEVSKETTETLSQSDTIQSDPITDVENQSDASKAAAFKEIWGFDKESVRVIGQIFSTYILAEAGDTMIIADQHAAHERLKYEELKKELASKEVISQMLLIPLAVDLSAAEYAIYQENKEKFFEMGFEIDDFGDATILVRATPEALDESELKSLIVELIDRFGENRNEIISEKMEYALYTIACKAAVKANHSFDLKQLEVLLKAVLDLERINTCPHGRPIIITMTKKELEKEFKRIV